MDLFGLLLLYVHDNEEAQLQIAFTQLGRFL